MATPSSNAPQSQLLLVCLVDDRADYRLIVEMIFKNYMPTHSLRLFESGQAFLDALPQLDTKPDLVLLDQHMPGLSGYQTLVALKKQPQFRSIPVVVMSADASHSEVSSFYEVGIKAFLPKPLELDALKQTLLTACQYARKTG